MQAKGGPRPWDGATPRRTAPPGPSESAGMMNGLRDDCQEGICVRVGFIKVTGSAEKYPSDKYRLIKIEPPPSDVARKSFTDEMKDPPPPFSKHSLLAGCLGRGLD